MNGLEEWVSWAQARARSDMDVLLPVVGAEGAGKSTFAFKLARALDPTFGPGRIQFSGALYMRQAMALPPSRANVWDELTEGGLAVETLTRENRDVLKFLITCRTLNQFHVVCVPTLDVLARYMRDWRAQWFADVERRGTVVFYRALRQSRLPNAKPYWQRQFRATFSREAGPGWDAYLARKREWVLDFERDSGAALRAAEASDAVAEGERKADALAGSLGWLRGVVVRGGGDDGKDA